MRYSDFVETYCRWISLPWAREQLSLKEKSNYDCIFWKQGCSVYEQRPQQCRSFPFWQSVVISAEAWETAAASCPGMGKGALHTSAEIASWLEEEDAETVIGKRSAENQTRRLYKAPPQAGEL
jgi:Fe-S-cluster containining protein